MQLVAKSPSQLNQLWLLKGPGGFRKEVGSEMLYNWDPATASLRTTLASVQLMVHRHIC